MNRRTKNITVPAFFAVLGALYLTIFFYLAFRTGIYDISAAHNDRFFSSDDVYFVTSFFSTVPEPSLRVIKHPLLCAFGWLFTRAEHLMFPGGISLTRHYELIVLLQILLSWLSSIFLYKTVTEHHGVKPCLALSAVLVYALAFSTVFCTMIAESYIFSSFALILTYYCARKNNYVLTALLGAVCAGVTVTNAAAWALIVVFSFEGRVWKRLVLLAAGGAAFCLAVCLSPFRETFFTNIISGGLRSAENYSDHFGLARLLPTAFYVFFGSTQFYLDTVDASPFGEFRGDALSFLPSAAGYVTALCLLWLAMLLLAVMLYGGDRRARAPMAVLAFNFVLHGVIQYGLKEGSLYSLHHFSAQVLLVSLLLADKRDTLRRAAFVAMLLFALCEVVFNLPGYREMLAAVP